MSDVVLYIFGVATLLSALGILITKNIMHAAYLLLVALICIAGIFIVFQSEFLATAQLIVYVGGILILLIFGIMLTNRLGSGHVKTQHHQIWLGLAVTLSFSSLVISRLTGLFKGTMVPQKTSLKSIGINLLSTNLITFEIAGILLLVVLIGATFIAKKQG